MAKRIGIIYCERIQDASCVGCAKCYKAVNDKKFVFEGDEDVQIVFKTGCGDCPGLVVPRVKLLTETAKSLGREIETLVDAPLAAGARALTGGKRLDGGFGEPRDFLGGPHPPDNRRQTASGALPAPENVLLRSGKRRPGCLRCGCCRWFPRRWR